MRFSRVIAFTAVLGALIPGAAQAEGPTASTARTCRPPAPTDSTSITQLTAKRIRVGSFTGGSVPLCSTARRLSFAVLDDPQCFSPPPGARQAGEGPFTKRCRTLGYACYNAGLYGAISVGGSVRCSRIAGRTKTVVKFQYNIDET